MARWIAAEERDCFERGLTAACYVVQHVDLLLHGLYLDPPVGVEDVLPPQPDVDQ